MFIQTESTPNPATLKFLPGQPVMKQGTADFTSAEQARVSPLATALFEVEGISGVYLGGDFITLTKAEGKDWLLLKPPVLGIIMDFFTSGKEAMTGSADAAHASGEGDEEIVEQIIELLDTRIRPAVAQDGGDITFLKYEAGVVYLSMRGSCAGCPSSTATLKNGIESMLRHYVPEVTEVRAG